MASAADADELAHHIVNGAALTAFRHIDQAGNLLRLAQFRREVFNFFCQCGGQFRIDISADQFLVKCPCCTGESLSGLPVGCS